MTNVRRVVITLGPSPRVVMQGDLLLINPDADKRFASIERRDVTHGS